MEFGSLIAGLVTGLREGVEAALIVSIILAYLAKTGNRRHFNKIWIGTAAAVALSLAIGVVLFVTIGGFEQPYEQLFEAGTMILATAVLTWMLFWMRRQARMVKGELQAAVDRVLTEGGGWGLAVLALTAVIREGVETSLFMTGQVTAAASQGAGAELSLLVGALLGLVIAVAIGWVIYVGARRINYATFFRLTGVSLVFIAAGLLSHAVHELIDIGSITVLTGTAFDISTVLPDDAGIGLFLRALFGYAAAPEVLTLIVYLAYLVPVLFLYLRPVPVAPPTPERAAAPTTQAPS
ncbi:MAG: high-affinity iron transporter [Chloroflexota bacterium]|nr:high-affinity iron transporter [Chloroflexota bacterium]